MLIAAYVRELARVVVDELALVAGIMTTVIFFTVGATWLAQFSNMPWLIVMFVWLFCAMIWCALRVAHHANILAELWGEPYGTLILTLSIVAIEATVMATIMLGGDPNPTLPRDTMFAVLMIVLNGIVGLALAVGAMRHVQQQYNLQGAIAFLAVISPLAIIALVVPKFTQSTSDPTLTPVQATIFGLLTAFLYGAFLLIQTSRHRSFFREPQSDGIEANHAGHPPAVHTRLRGGAFHAITLFATLLPVVLLSEPLAKLLDYGIEQIGMPTSLAGILIAILILSPEGAATFQAAARNQLQRAVNLSLGSALSTIGLTVPIALGISVLAGMHLQLGLDQAEIVLLALTLFICNMTFSGAPTNILLGFVHLVLFFAYLVLVFQP